MSVQDQTFHVEQIVQQPRREVFAFFSDPSNLEKITPPWLRFRVVKQSTPRIRRGTELTYRLKLHGIPALWRSLIVEWEPERRFTDVQLQGPYAKWHHTHTFEDADGGTRIRDSVTYRLPLGWLGHTMGGRFVESDIRRIFEFRRHKTAELLEGL